jgi:hypothetical protein
LIAAGKTLATRARRRYLCQREGKLEHLVGTGKRKERIDDLGEMKTQIFAWVND